MIKKRSFYFLLLVGSLMSVILLFQSQSYRLKSNITSPPGINDSLIQLGKSALLTKDVPVGCIIIYKDEIIGQGFNTVQRDQELSGHAEINALNQVFQNLGNDFKYLNQDSLFVYSTFEPCEMCKGAFIHYGMENIYFEENKSASSQIKSTIKGFIYEIDKRRFEGNQLQQDLFNQHPDYDPKNRE